MAEGAPQARLILAGRTGLDQRLRRASAYELVRVRTPIEAIGELADPIAPDSPSAVGIVLGAGADPAEKGEGERFVEAARTVDADVVLLASQQHGGQSPYDAVLDSADPAQTVEAWLLGARGGNGAVQTPAASSIPASQASDRPQPIEADPARREGATQPRQTLHEGSPLAGLDLERFAPGGEVQIMDAMIAGRSMQEPAIEVVRARLGRPDLRLIVDDPADGAAQHVEPVVWRDARLGALVCQTPAPPNIKEAAAWVARWLVLECQRSQLQQAAFRDPLTGAWNRRYLDHHLPRLLERARRARRPVSVLVFDIDDFKWFNDQHSHAAGDEILCETVRLLTSLTRPTDRVCRVGGDEFVVIFDEPTGPREPGSTPPASVYDIALRFQREICRQRFPKLGEAAPGTLTISGGLATYPWDGTSAQALIDRADRLAIQSKQQGKDVLKLGPGAERWAACDLMQAPERPPTPS